MLAMCVPTAVPLAVLDPSPPSRERGEVSGRQSRQAVPSLDPPPRSPRSTTLPRWGGDADALRDSAAWVDARAPNRS